MENKYSIQIVGMILSFIILLATILSWEKQEMFRTKIEIKRVQNDSLKTIKEIKEAEASIKQYEFLSK